MMSKYRITGKLDTGRLQEGTVTIDRVLGLFSVRPLRRHRAYTLPLGTVAEIIVSKVIKGEVAEKRREKSSKRKAWGGSK